MSSIVATGSSLVEMREEVREPCLDIDFLFKVLLRSSRKLGCMERLPFGDVGGSWELNGVRGICWGGGDRTRGSGGPLLRRCIVGGGVFLNELCFHEDVLEDICGWGLTTATFGAPV